LRQPQADEERPVSNKAEYQIDPRIDRAGRIVADVFIAVMAVIYVLAYTGILKGGM
jgi:hypothetical protein